MNVSYISAYGKIVTMRDKLTPDEAVVGGVKIDFCEVLPNEGTYDNGTSIQYNFYDRSVFGDDGDSIQNLSPQLIAILSSGASGIPFMTYDMAGYAYTKASGYFADGALVALCGAGPVRAFDKRHAQARDQNFS